MKAQVQDENITKSRYLKTPRTIQTSNHGTPNISCVNTNKHARTSTGHADVHQKIELKNNNNERTSDVRSPVVANGKVKIESKQSNPRESFQTPQNPNVVQRGVTGINRTESEAFVKPMDLDVEDSPLGVATRSADGKENRCQIASVVSTKMSGGSVGQLRTHSASSSGQQGQAAISGSPQSSGHSDQGSVVIMV